MENYKLSSAKTREKVTSILKTCGFLGNFDGSGKSGQGRNSHLQDLFYAVSAPVKNFKLILSSVEPLVMVMNNLSGYLQNFLKNVESFGNFPERVLKPKFDMINARALYKDKELIIREELEYCIEQIDDDLNHNIQTGTNRTGNLSNAQRQSSLSLRNQRMPDRAGKNDYSAKSSQPRFNNRDEFENSVMEFFKDPNQDREDLAAFKPGQDADKMDFSRGLDISKIKVRQNRKYIFDF